MDATIDTTFAGMREFWQRRSRAGRLALTAGALAVGAGLAVALAPEVLAAAVSGAMVSGAAWVVRKGLGG